jgi:sialate O-acetylesterase
MPERQDPGLLNGSGRHARCRSHDASHTPWRRGRRPAGLVLVVATAGLGVMALTADATTALADVAMPAIFGDHMVLQAGRKLPFWGTASPGEEVTVSAATASGTATADKDGRWRLDLTPITATEPFAVTVRGHNTLTFADVVVGEVWVGSGQSNMEFPLIAAVRGEAETLAATVNNLRFFQVEKPDELALADHPAEVRGSWARATPESAALFSAVGYYFGRELSRALARPIGVIHASWGGSQAESWIRRQTLLRNPQLRHHALNLPKVPAAADVRAYRQAMAAWWPTQYAQDPGDTGEAAGFARMDTPAFGWAPVQVPGYWEDTTGLDLDGAVWFRKEIELPAAFVGESLTLRLGAIEDCDTTYVNGVKVGATCREHREYGRWPRAYTVPRALTAGRRMVIAVRVFDERGKGGFAGPRDSLRLVLGQRADGPALPLAGTWSYKVEASVAHAPKPGTPPRPQPPPGLYDHHAPGSLWDNMVAALVPFAIRGVIWYQGEANTKRAYEYRALLPALIDDWRNAWGQGVFPFLVVQLASYHPRWPGAGQRSEDEWAELREAQALTAAHHPATGLAVTIDLGTRDDIHPTEKQEVGRRLALVALAKAYEQPIDHSGPVWKAMVREKGGRLRLSFDHAEGLAVNAGGGRLLGFELAGADRRFVAAEAQIEGNTVVLSAPNLPAPLAARYAWSDDPACNLVNRAGLPAVPFRTDNWPALTASRK